MHIIRKIGDREWAIVTEHDRFTALAQRETRRDARVLLAEMERQRKRKQRRRIRMRG